MGQPVGAQITNYLLEKNRVVGQIRDERDFHIFYQFTKGASPEQQGKSSLDGSRDACSLAAEAFGLQGPESYAYISRSGCLDVRSINDVADFQETLVSSSSASHPSGRALTSRSAQCRSLA